LAWKLRARSARVMIGRKGSPSGPAKTSWPPIAQIDCDAPLTSILQTDGGSDTIAPVRLLIPNARSEPAARASVMASVSGGSSGGIKLGSMLPFFAHERAALLIWSNVTYPPGTAWTSYDSPEAPKSEGGQIDRTSSVSNDNIIQRTPRSQPSLSRTCPSKSISTPGGHSSGSIFCRGDPFMESLVSLLPHATSEPLWSSRRSLPAADRSFSKNGLRR
jgi:hypothetical protein